MTMIVATAPGPARHHRFGRQANGTLHAPWVAPVCSCTPHYRCGAKKWASAKRMRAPTSLTTSRTPARRHGLPDPPTPGSIRANRSTLPRTVSRTFATATFPCGAQRSRRRVGRLFGTARRDDRATDGVPILRPRCSAATVRHHPIGEPRAHRSPARLQGQPLLLDVRVDFSVEGRHGATPWPQSMAANLGAIRTGSLERLRSPPGSEWFGTGTAGRIRPDTATDQGRWTILPSYRTCH